MGPPDNEQTLQIYHLNIEDFLNVLNYSLSVHCVASLSKADSPPSMCKPCMYSLPKGRGAFHSVSQVSSLTLGA